jgi:hypothetical protein
LRAFDEVEEISLPRKRLLRKNWNRGRRWTPRVWRRGGSISSEADIEALHASLIDHFKGLRAEYEERPLYLLEHGLAPDEIDQLVRATRTTLLSRSIAGGWWALNPLPLLVAATEVGYAYRGTGTDFWPIFDERLGATAIQDRSSLSALFKSVADRLMLAQPTDTPWNRAFCHIAWPVLHAILPLELHRPLARALREVRVHLDPAAPDGDIVAPVRNRALLAGGIRLIGWLEDQRTAAAVIRHFLQPSANGALHGPALSRIAKDLALDETANDALREARKRQQALAEPARRPRRRSADIEFKLAPLVLRSGADHLSLAIKVPQLEQALRETVRSALVALRWRAMLWSQSRPIPARNLFSDFPIPVTLDHLPSPDTPLLGDISSLPIGPEAKEFLGSIRAQTTAPLLFADTLVAGEAIQLLSGRCTSNSSYIVLVNPEQRPAPSAEHLGRVAGLRAYRADTSRHDAVDWLAQMGIELRQSAIRFEWIGIPEVEQHRPVRRFRRGGFLAFRIEGAGGNVSAELTAPDGSRGAIAGDGSLSGGFVADRTGRYEIRYGPGDKMMIDVVDDVDEAPLVMIDMDAGTASISDLADRELTVRFESSRTIQDARFELNLKCDGREVASLGGTLPDTPCRLNRDDEIWEKLLSAPVVERLLGAKSAELRVSLPGLAEESFAFEQQMAPFAWEGEPSGALRAEDEAGELRVFAARPSAPLRLFSADGVAPDRDIILLRAGRGSPLQFGGLCHGPSIWRASDAPVIGRPERLLRQFQTKGSDEADGCRVADALIAWSGAHVDHSVTQFRRGQVVRHLERWLVEQCCGAAWVSREAQQAGTSARSHARAFLDACKALHVGYADVRLTGEQASLLDRILLRLIDDRALPIGPNGGEPLDEELAIALDGLFNDAYATLAERIEAVGDRPAFDPDEDIDVGEASDAWDRVVATAGSRALLSNLVDLLRPLDAADGLSLADFESMIPDDVVDLLHQWIAKNQPQHHARSWSRDLVESAYWLFARPAVAARLSWRGAAERLLADRFSARALRYAALRSGSSGVAQ